MLMFNKRKGMLLFALLYILLFVFDGVRLLQDLLRSSAANYLAYTGLFLYGCILFKSELIHQWNEIKNAKKRFLFRGLQGFIFLFLMTFLFAFLSGLLRQTLGLGGAGQNELILFLL